ncbi:hypothetical protein SAMN05216218_1175 [Halorientalis regularis]|jgi:hypothetical protein|uniref:Uncharacterized protein n=1 Tax=Halorientalis regularis TaxID=660518 RepID=A0A1G7S272_9EURY|nr:hypothetical protein SAMN05216218_1175 [Halorientalis regularis]
MVSRQCSRLVPSTVMIAVACTRADEWYDSPFERGVGFSVEFGLEDVSLAGLAFRRDP